MIGSLGILNDPPDLPPNQGQTKIEDMPGCYRLTFSPSDPNQEYVVTVYECDPSGGQSTISSPSTSPSPSPTPRPTPSPEPAPDPQPDRGTLMEAGGAMTGPVLIMPNGRCPREFPKVQDGACHS